MAYLPLEHKYLIQTSYVRYRELAKEIPDIDRQVLILQWVHWGSVAGLIWGVVRAVLDKPGLPNAVGGLLLLGLIFGWAAKSDAKKKQKKLFTEKHEIWKAMDNLGVHFPLSSVSTHVYAGSIADENIVSPLHDSSYR